MGPSSTSSSEDEDMTKFIEASDNSLYNKYLKEDNKGALEAPFLPSLRNVEEQEQQHVHKGINVTPAFQKHVAHHLTQLLDSQLLMDENSKDSINTSVDSDDLNLKIRKIARAKRMLAPPRLTSIEQVSVPVSSPRPSQSNSGVRLFGASAVFLSNLDIVPANTRRRPKRGRKVAQFSSGSESSDEESGSTSDSDDMEKFSAAAVSPDWVLSGAATKGWARKEGKVERCILNKSGVLLPLNERDSHHKYGATNALSNNNNDKEVLSDSAKDDLFSLRSKKKNKKKKRRALSLDGDTLVASFNAAVSITAETPCDTAVRRRQKKKSHKKRRKDHNSEDATTETTEVEEIGEGRKKKIKKRKKQKKKAREDIGQEVQDLLKEEEEDEGIIVKDSPLRKRKKKKSKKYKEKPNRESFMKVSKTISKPLSRKQLKHRMASLSSELAKLVMGSYEGAQDAVS